MDIKIFENSVLFSKQKTKKFNENQTPKHFHVFMESETTKSVVCLLLKLGNFPNCLSF